MTGTRTDWERHVTLCSGDHVEIGDADHACIAFLVRDNEGNEACVYVPQQQAVELLDSALREAQRPIATPSETAPPQGFHVEDGLWFSPQEDGGVVAVVRSSADSDATMLKEIRMTASEWASLILAMSARDEESVEFNIAEAFHKNEPIELL